MLPGCGIPSGVSWPVIRHLQRLCVWCLVLGPVLCSGVVRVNKLSAEVAVQFCGSLPSAILFLLCGKDSFQKKSFKKKKKVEGLLHSYMYIFLPFKVSWEPLPSRLSESEEVYSAVTTSESKKEKIAPVNLNVAFCLSFLCTSSQQ